MTQRASASASSQGQRRYSRGKPSGNPSRCFSRLPRRAALALALALLLALAGCDQSAVQPPPVHPTLTPTPAALPAFTDWRAAYLSSDGSVHVITLDGKTDLSGPTLPGLASNAVPLASAGASPDGHLLAYNSTGLVLVTVAATGGGTVRNVFTRVVVDMDWSPDSRQLALSDNSGGISLLKMTEKEVMPIPGLPITGEATPILGMGNPSLWGWLDASHLAIGGYPISGGTESTTAYSLGLLDVTAGTLRTIATIHSPGLGAPAIVLSPDGTHALFYNGNLHDRPFTPIVDAIDIATGTVTPLPAIVRTTQGTQEPLGIEYTSAAWRPGTHQLAVSTGFLPNNDLKVWLLDLDRDTATPLLNGQYVARWSPDGATLVVTTSEQAQIGLGPHDLSAVTFDSGGQPHVTLLTHDAMSFPFLGFVRTA